MMAIFLIPVVLITESNVCFYHVYTVYCILVNSKQTLDNSTSIKFDIYFATSLGRCTIFVM